MPIFTSEITLGTLLTIATLVGIAVSIAMRFGRVEMKQDAHAKSVESLAAAILRHDERDNERFAAVEVQIDGLVKTVYLLVGKGDQPAR